MTILFRRDDVRRAPLVSAGAARERMIQEQIATGWDARPPAAGGLRQDAAPQPRMVSAEAARDRMMLRDRRRGQ